MITGEDLYWCTRRLKGIAGSIFKGNHHFIVFISNPEKLNWLSPTEPPDKLREEDGTFFITLATFERGGYLLYEGNNDDDVQAVRQGVDGGAWEFQYKKVPPPAGMSDFQLIQKVEGLLHVYTRNTQHNPLEYSSNDENCAAWVNTILHYAGVDKSVRKSIGNFKGIDWGESDLLPSWCFT